MAGTWLEEHFTRFYHVASTVLAPHFVDGSASQRSNIQQSIAFSSKTSLSERKYILCTVHTTIPQDELTHEHGISLVDKYQIDIQRLLGSQVKSNIKLHVKSKNHVLA